MKKRSSSTLYAINVWIGLSLVSAAAHADLTDYLTFHPSKDLMINRPPIEYSLGVSPTELHIEAANGNKLHLWYFKNDLKPKALIVHFHGNSGNISSNFQEVAWLASKGYPVLTFDYQGYGKSEGKVNGLTQAFEDGKAVLRFAHNNKSNILSLPNNTPIIVIGQSLGGVLSRKAVADLKEEVPVQLLIQDSTFTSFYKVFKSILPSLVGNKSEFIPDFLLKFITQDDKNFQFLEDDLKHIPLLVIHGEDDKTIPVKYGKELYALSLSVDKDLWIIPNCDHVEAILYDGLGTKSWHPDVRTRLIEYLDSRF